MPLGGWWGNRDTLLPQCLGGNIGGVTSPPSRDGCEALCGCKEGST
jgi:hypothetical protein